jgi:hypothetical protein
MPAAAPTALTITIRQAIDLLDSDFAALADGVAHRRYAFWLGSGISRERVDDLMGRTPGVVDVEHHARGHLGALVQNWSIGAACSRTTVHHNTSLPTR